jgi:hypothetical protein
MGTAETFSNVPLVLSDALNAQTRHFEYNSKGKFEETVRELTV